MTAHRTLPSRRRFTVKEYYKMAKAGVLREDERVELIGGAVIVMAPIGNPPASHVDRNNLLLIRRFSDVAIVRCQGHVELDDHDQPQPDLALLRPRPDFYASGSPKPADVFLIIEVSDTTLRYDRRIKGRLYASAGILEYWIIDVNRATLTVYRDPSPDGYQTIITLRRGDTVAPLAFPDREIPVSDILGEA